ncbi:type 1 glutamine amidotransferase domain-containing protein [Bosea sp. NPDC055332]
MKILIILTSHDQLGNTGRKTGFWLEEFATPYYAFRDAGAEIVLASPLGGRPPLDPRSAEPGAQTEATRRLEHDAGALAALTATRRLADVAPEDFDAVFFPGGHGPLWDLAEDPVSIALIERMIEARRPVAALCHGPAIFLRTRAVDGRPLVEGRSVTGFTNSEEEAEGLTDTVPFLVEDMLRRNGGRYSQAPNWQSHVAIDDLLVTGQNPASSSAVAEALLEKLSKLQR